MMHFTIDARDFADKDSGWERWRAIADGQYDKEILAQARGIAAIRSPVFVTFDHEPDQPRRAVQGSPADYVDAWRHVHGLYDQAGAGNVVWVWVVTGWMPSIGTAMQMWPGNQYVDWISWDAYDDRGCRSGQAGTEPSKSFGDIVQPYLDYIEKHGPTIGMDVRKPIMISEAGTALVDSPASPSSWYEGIPVYLSTHHQIKAVNLWDHAGRIPTCSYQFSKNPDRSRDVAVAGRSAWVNPLAQVR